MVEKFPVFLKTASGTNYYCIVSETHVIEFQRVGSRFIRQEWEATTLPERWYLHDLLQNTNGNIESMTSSEFIALTGYLP